MVLLYDPLFLESDLHRTLRQMPLGFIDIGARGGVQPLAAPVAALTAVLAFEPDAAAAAELRAMPAAPWQQVAVEATAVGGHDGTATLHLFAHGVNHSLLPAAPAFRERYQVASLADRGTVTVRVETLDGILFGRRVDEPYWGELLKLDVQGLELDILRSAPRTLAERTVAIVAEVSFLDIYAGQPRFSDLERFLAGQGFTFYGFTSLQGWSCKYIDKRRASGRERLCFGDAVFLRDPLSGGGAQTGLSPRQWAVLYLAALLLGYFDFAIELAVASDHGADETERLVELARRMAERPPADAIGEVEALLASMKADPGNANIELGRFCDRHRTLFDVSDAALPRLTPVPKARRLSGPPPCPTTGIGCHDQG